VNIQYSSIKEMQSTSINEINGSTCMNEYFDQSERFFDL
jgi:hypothetical protein